MKKHFLSFLLLLLTTLQARAIVGGTPFSLEDYKQSAFVGFQSIRGTKMDICSGVLLNSTTVLTAAHCFDNMSISTITIFKSTDMNRDRSNQMRISNSQVILHPGYLASNKVNFDFAIVKLNRTFDGPETIYYPALMANTRSDYYGLYGYGFDENQQHSVFKKVFKTKNDILESSNKDLISIDQSNGQGICSGDSGGPLLVAFNNVAYVIAINDSVSGPAGRDCYGKGYFRKVGPVIDWIQSNM